MAFKIVRNDITQMNTEAIVNTANADVMVGPGCDEAIYKAAGYDKLLEYRKQHIGPANEGDVFITPGFDLKARYIIHAVSPLFTGGDSDEDVKLHSCYRKSLELAKVNGIKSIAFPLISTGSFGYPKAEGMRIAVDEINAFLLENEMDITLVVYDDKAADLASRLSPQLADYISGKYEPAPSMRFAEYMGRGGLQDSRAEGRSAMAAPKPASRPFSESEFCAPTAALPSVAAKPKGGKNSAKSGGASGLRDRFSKIKSCSYSLDSVQDIADDEEDLAVAKSAEMSEQGDLAVSFWDDEDKLAELERQLAMRTLHRSDTFSEYLLYLIQSKGMDNVEVRKRAAIDKKLFSKIKNNPEYHPTKITALLLCVGAMLSLDETKDLLARAGYALSPCDLTDIIFSFFIENKHYDVVDIDIYLEEYGLPCIIS